MSDSIAAEVVAEVDLLNRTDPDWWHAEHPLARTLDNLDPNDPRTPTWHRLRKAHAKTLGGGAR